MLSAWTTTSVAPLLSTQAIDTLPGSATAMKLELSLNQLSEAAGGVPAEENSNKRARV